MSAYTTCKWKVVQEALANHPLFKDIITSAERIKGISFTRTDGTVMTSWEGDEITIYLD